MSSEQGAKLIAKILARATSDVPAESAGAIVSAMNRMNRDGVRFEDLISIDAQYLYQEALVMLAGALVREKNSLSQESKRILYQKYFSLIYEKYRDENNQDSWLIT